jgi:GntR family transcriptional regulator
VITWRQGEPVWEEDRARWKQIAEELRGRIENGQYRPRNAIPSIVQLEQEFGVSRDTVRRVIRHLIEQNMVRVETGVGTFVRPKSEWSTSREEDP